MDPISPEQLKDLSDTIVQIEMAEDDLLDAATIWQVLTRHLKGHGGGGDSGEENLARAQYWPARSYLVTWLSCRRGENMPRQAMVKQILRMWEICPGLKPSTYRLCSEHFQMSDLSTLNDVQLRAALWITLADWQRFWEARAGEGPCVAPDD